MLKAAAQEDENQSILNHLRRKTKLKMLPWDMLKAEAQEDEDESILNNQRGRQIARYCPGTC